MINDYAEKNIYSAATTTAKNFHLIQIMMIEKSRKKKRSTNYLMANDRRSHIQNDVFLLCSEQPESF